MPPSDHDAKCSENTSVRDEAWDRCVKRSSLSIGLGTLVGAVSSIYAGTNGIMISMSLCVAWAVNNCRSLFREQKEGKKIALTAPPVLPKSPKESKKKDIIECQTKKEKTTKNEKKEKKLAAQSCDKDKKKGSKVNYSFPCVFPIPDRPFGGVRGELEKLRTVTNVPGKQDKNQPPVFIKPQNVQHQDCIQSPPGCQDNQEQLLPPSPPPPPPKPSSPAEEEEFNVKLEMGDDTQCECTIERYRDCIHVDCTCPVPKFAENDQCTCDDNAIPNFTIKCQPPPVEGEHCECTCDDYDDVDGATAGAQYDNNAPQEEDCGCHQPQATPSVDTCTCP